MDKNDIEAVLRATNPLQHVASGDFSDHVGYVLSSLDPQLFAEPVLLIELGSSSTNIPSSLFRLLRRNSKPLFRRYIGVDPFGAMFSY